MNNTLLIGLTLFTALGCGLVAGFFFAFSVCVMRALSRLPTAQGIAAMQLVNVVVLKPWFLGVFFGTGAACVFLSLWSLISRIPGAACLLAGSVLYLIGAILVTIFFNVPRNNALATADPESSAGAKLWADYLTTWTAWNHVRTITSFGAAALFVAALYFQSRAWL